jgi:ABC-type antimicrobial peptide transport system permease subunit
MNYNFGFNQANILDVALQGVSPQQFRNEFSTLAPVQNISMSSGILGVSASGSVWVKNSVSDSVEVDQLFIDNEYINALSLQLVAGKNFESDSLSLRQVIVNEEFLKTFRIDHPSAGLHQVFTVGHESVEVIGVVKNFHYADLRSPIGSFFFRYDPGQFQFANLTLTTTDMTASINTMERSWKKIEPEKKFMARFFDDEIRESYTFYFAMVKICGFLGLLAISISCLGMLGMVVFSVENRMKEVGIRKAMGASGWSITLVLSKDFVRLMIMAAVLATPLAYLFFDKLYLQSQQYYHSSVGAAEIIISLLLVFILGLTTILSQTLKAARANPVDTLRYE